MKPRHTFDQFGQGDNSSEHLPAQTDPGDSRDDAEYAEDERQDGKGRGESTQGRKERDGLGPLCDSPEIIARITEVGNKGALLRQNGKRQKHTPISKETREEERRAESIARRIVHGECKRNSGVDEEV